MASTPEPVYTSPRNEAHLRDVLSRLSTSIDAIVIDIEDLENTLLREATFDSNTTSGQLLYASGSGTVDLAQADALATSRVIGMAVQDVLATESGLYLVTGSLQRTGWGLTTNTVYYLSPTAAGSMTTTKPSTTGQIVKVVGIAASTEIFAFLPQMSIQL